MLAAATALGAIHEDLKDICERFNDYLFWVRDLVKAFKEFGPQGMNAKATCASS